MLLNDDILNIEKPDEICWLLYTDVDEFSGLLYTYQSLLFNIQDLHK